MLLLLPLFGEGTILKSMPKNHVPRDKRLVAIEEIIGFN